MAKKWMQKAFSANPGALHRKLHVPEDEKIPAKKLAAAKKKADKTGDTHLSKQLALAARGKAASSGQDTAMMGMHGKKGGHAGYGR